MSTRNFNTNTSMPGSIFSAQDKPLSKAIENLRQAADQDFSGMESEELEAIALYLETEVQE